MRFAVRLFVSLLERFSGLAEGAYYLVAWIGLKLLISGFHTGDYLPFKIEEWLFWSGMALIAVVSLLAKPRRKKPEEEDAGQALDLIESDDEHGSADGRSSDDKGPQDGRSSDDQVHQDGGARGSS
jgi:hypothetical protein